MWLLIIVCAYFLLALASLFDRFLLAGPLPNPMVYACLTGLLGGLALFLIPFGFGFPGIIPVLISLLAGVLFIFALYLLFSAIYWGEVSRVVPTIGALLPFFSLMLALTFVFPKPIISFSYIAAFVFLILGSFLITWGKDRKINSKSFVFSLFSALCFAFAFFLMKKVYLEQSFIAGFVWMRIGGFLAGLGFLLFSETREFFKQKKIISQKQISLPFFLGQALGGLGFVLQNYAVNLASFDKVPLINALEGIRHVFLLFFVFALGRYRPQLLKEDISFQSMKQKFLAVLLIGLGLVLVALN